MHDQFPGEGCLIDAGCFSESNFLNLKIEKINWIFITHSHYDHIYSLNEIVSHFPNSTVYCSKNASVGLVSSKTNLSFYHDSPIEYHNNNVILVSEGDQIEVFKNELISVYKTPGHNIGSISFKIRNFLFTGDSLIPNIPVVTKLKSGNKDQAKQSISKIKNILNPDDLICPGHMDICSIEYVNWNIYL